MVMGMSLSPNQLGPTTYQVTHNPCQCPTIIGKKGEIDLIFISRTDVGGFCGPYAIILEDKTSFVEDLSI